MILPASVTMFTDLSLCFCPSLHVVNLCLCPYPPSFTFTKACPSLRQRDSISLLLSVPFLISHVKISDLSRCQLCISSTYNTIQHLRHRLSLFCTEAVPTQQFYMQQSNATPRPSTPSSGGLPPSPFKEEVLESFIQFLLIVHIQIVTFKVMKSACHQGKNAILMIVIFP